MFYHQIIMRVLVFIVWIVVSGPFAACADVPALMGKLSSDDPASRDQAGRELLAAGPAARPALVAALRSDDPELRLRAAGLLLQMPWTHPDDPPAVRDVLADYGKPDVEHRLRKIVALADLPDGAGGPASLRLLVEEPVESVRWMITGNLRLNQSSRIWSLLCQMDPAGRGAAELAAMGWAWTHYDPRHAIELMRQAIAKETEHAEDSHGEMTPLLRYVVEQERLVGNFDEVGRLLRRMLVRGGGVVRAMELMALHVGQGPMEGYERDRAICDDLLSPALRLYIDGKLDQRQGKDEAAERKFQQALEMGKTPLEHLQTGDRLLEQDWDPLAEREFNKAAGKPGPREENFVANAHFRLARIAQRRGDDYQTAEHLRQCLEAIDQATGAVLTEAEAKSIWAELYWRYYLAATSRGDRAEAEKNLVKLLNQQEIDRGIVMDLTPKLLAGGHKEEGMRLFDAAYQPARAQLDLDPENPELSNNLAWFCARSGQRLDEALQAARRATAIAPNHPAYLDTQAEAEYRNGNRETAIVLEKRALELRPRDLFMQKQLRRFEAGLP